ncbi:MBL fold metallo-hydrolase RNA specificity domain-containing protein [Parapedobacter pyrenivorans]|uniref:MBL fold metallo-hydrolase RNA specificity domain-containing protein n=1 Tax=Parapedobacter pyrenivorans TaxID=1305674 RepID=UPI00333F4D8F
MGVILADFLVRRAEGYYCKYGDFFIDPPLPVGRALITHAHADHASPGHGMIFCTPPTASFMRYRYRHLAVHAFSEFSYHHPFSVGGVAIRFIPAGHILGSAQIVMDYNGVTYLFTGDYKVQADDTCEPLEAMQADVLITESTFADPQVRHPDPVAEISKLNDKPSNVLLGAYTLGKAQRLTSLINTHCPSRKVLIHHTILPIHQLYRSLGVDHLCYAPYERRLMKADGFDYIYIVPPLTFNSYFRATNVLRVFASGWKRLQHNNDMELFISDHVDWNDIMGYVNLVKPLEIWTVHGEGKHLAEHFAGSIAVKAIG